MVLVRLVVGAVLIAGLVGPSFAGDQAGAVARNAEAGRDRPTEPVLVRIDSAVQDKGLKVICPIEVSAASRWPVRLSVPVVNLLEEEVFLTVQSVELTNLGYTLFQEWPDGSVLETTGGGGPGLVFPDNTGLLKRLHACQYDEGIARPCGCAAATVRISIGEEGDPVDLTLPIRGYFRRNGKAFAKDVEVPFIVIEEPR